MGDDNSSSIQSGSTSTPPSGEGGFVKHKSHGSFLLRLRHRIFEGFIAFSHGPPIHRPLFLFLNFVGLLQILLFPLSPSLYWRQGGSNPVLSFHGFLLAVTFSPYTDPTGSVLCYSRLAMYVVACVYSATMVVVSLQYISGSLGPKQGRIRMQILRVLLHVALHAGLAPLTTNLLSPLVCDAEGTWAGFNCWGGSHLAALCVGVLLAAAQLLLFLLAAIMFKSPTLDLKSNPTLQSHGRGQALRVLIVSGLAAFFMLAPGVSPWAHVLINTLGGFVLLAIQVATLEYYDQFLNRALSAMHAVFLVADVAALLSVGLVGSGSSPSTLSWGVSAAGIAWAFLTPFAAQAGWFAATLYWRQVGASRSLANPYIFELRVRYLLTEGKNLGGGVFLGTHAMDAAAAAAEAGAPPAIVRSIKELYGSGDGGGKECPVMGPMGGGGGEGAQGGEGHASTPLAMK